MITSNQKTEERLAKFRANVLPLKSGPRLNGERCHKWYGARNSSGYGSFTNEEGRTISAHVWLWQTVNGPYERGMNKTSAKKQLDHLCRNRWCVNLKHLELVDQSTNLIRGNNPYRDKTHCPQGHEYTPENTRYVNHKSQGGRPSRHCKTCVRNRAREWARKNRSKHHGR